MKKILIFFVLFFILVQLWGSSSAFLNEKPEQIKPLSDIIIYCNTKEFVHDMVSNSYHMQIATKGSVNDEHHKHLMETQLWINSNNNQWSIVFVYKNVDKSCVLGGNDMELYSPSEIKE